MFVGSIRTLLIIVALFATMKLPARADGRAELIACQALIDRTAQAKQADAAAAPQDDATLRRCQQIIRDWTLRESRMSVDEQGRPLR